jgi:hypothetical protein
MSSFDAKIPLSALVVFCLLTVWGAAPCRCAEESGAKDQSIEQSLDDSMRQDREAQPAQSEKPESTENNPVPATKTSVTPPRSPDFSLLAPPNDPCLPTLYRDWQELSAEEQGSRAREFIAYRIVINRTSFLLSFEGLRRDKTVQQIYSTYVGLGDLNTPTPEGHFIINHIYCYPDVLYFDPSSQKIAGLYNGFFAPILMCDQRGHCSRYRELGIHGYNKNGASGRASRAQTYGAISAGCIRVPDPCRLKTELVRFVGIGAIRQNERGSYHWLNKRIEVTIADKYPESEDDMTLASILQQSLDQVQGGIKDILNLFGN